MPAAITPIRAVPELYALRDAANARCNAAREAMQFAQGQLDRGRRLGAPQATLDWWEREAEFARDRLDAATGDWRRLTREIEGVEHG